MALHHSTVAHRTKLALLAVLSVFLYALALPLAVPGWTDEAAADHVDQAVIDELASSGVYAATNDPEFIAASDAISFANQSGIAVVWTDEAFNAGDRIEAAEFYAIDLDEAGSSYETVLLITPNNYASASVRYTVAELVDAESEAIPGFEVDASEGIRQFVVALVSGSQQSTATTANQGGATDSTSSSENSGGISIGTILLVAAALFGGFTLFRGFSARRKAREIAEAELEKDRAEIAEQLKDNADRVINLGDRVIASGNADLISKYEEASETYQEVSERAPEAESADEIDTLDDRIDHAEWQLESIEAELADRPIPPSPAEKAAQQLEAEKAARQAEQDQLDEQRRRHEERQRAQRSQRRRQRSRQPRSSYGGGMFGSGGGILGGILGEILIGQMGNRSRRSQRRSGGGFGGGISIPQFPSSGGGSSSRTSGSGRRSGRKPTSRSGRRPTRR